MDSEFIRCIGLIKSSKNKFKIMKSLKNELKIPSEISKETNIGITHVSNLLKELKDNDLVMCLNEDSKKGRLYILTQKGKEILEFVIK